MHVLRTEDIPLPDPTNSPPEKTHASGLETPPQQQCTALAVTFAISSADRHTKCDLEPHSSPEANWKEEAHAPLTDGTYQAGRTVVTPHPPLDCQTMLAELKQSLRLNPNDDVNDAHMFVRPAATTPARVARKPKPRPRHHQFQLQMSLDCCRRNAPEKPKHLHPYFYHDGHGTATHMDDLETPSSTTLH